MNKRKTPTHPGIQAQRKLSEILIEIARIGWKAPFRDQDPAPITIHILMLLASEAWNRENQAEVQYPSAGQRVQIVDQMRAGMGLSQADLKRQFISTDWETIIELMRVYKQHHFPEDYRQIVACGYTPQETWRVAWK